MSFPKEYGESPPGPPCHARPLSQQWQVVVSHL